MGSPSQPLNQVYPEVALLRDKCINDLYNDGLMNTQSINVSITVQGMVAKRTTQLGDEFLSFLKLYNLTAIDSKYFLNKNLLKILKDL